MSAAQINVTTLIDETERLPCGDWQLVLGPRDEGPSQLSKRSFARVTLGRDMPRLSRVRVAASAELDNLFKNVPNEGAAGIAA